MPKGRFDRVRCAERSALRLFHLHSSVPRGQLRVSPLFPLAASRLFLMAMAHAKRAEISSADVAEQAPQPWRFTHFEAGKCDGDAAPRSSYGDLQRLRRSCAVATITSSTVINPDPLQKQHATARATSRRRAKRIRPCRKKTMIRMTCNPSRPAFSATSACGRAAATINRRMRCDPRQ